MNFYALLLSAFPLSVFLAWVTFELLIRRLFVYHRGEWIQLGSPASVFTGADVDDLWDAGMAYRGLTGRWLLETPRWISGDPPARMILYLHRLFAIMVLAGPVGFVIIALLLS